MISEKIVETLILNTDSNSIRACAYRDFWETGPTTEKSYEKWRTASPPGEKTLQLHWFPHLFGSYKFMITEFY